MSSSSGNRTCEVNVAFGLPCFGVRETHLNPPCTPFPGLPSLFLKSKSDVRIRRDGGRITGGHRGYTQKTVAPSPTPHTPCSLHPSFPSSPEEEISIQRNERACVSGRIGHALGSFQSCSLCLPRRLRALQSVRLGCKAA